MNEYDIGDTVICDFCGVEYTHSTDQGGLLFGSKAVCPQCTPKLEKDAARYGESRYITSRAHDGETFADFVRRLRDGDNRVILRQF